MARQLGNTRSNPPTFILSLFRFQRRSKVRRHLCHPSRHHTHSSQGKEVSRLWRHETDAVTCDRASLSRRGVTGLRACITAAAAALEGPYDAPMPTTLLYRFVCSMCTLRLQGRVVQQKSHNGTDILFTRLCAHVIYSLEHPRNTNDIREWHRMIMDTSAFRMRHPFTDPGRGLTGKWRSIVCTCNVVTG